MDDDGLVAHLASDLDAAFEPLVRAHQDRLYTIALRMLGDPSDAEEVAQDALVRAYRALATNDGARIRDLRLRPWLAAIVVNLARNRATRRRQPPSVPLSGPPEEGRRAQHEPADQDESLAPDGRAVRREAIDYWAGLLSALPASYRTAIVLHHVDGMTFSEMAETLGRPEGTLKARVHRGIALLRAAHESADRAAREEMTA